MYIHYPLAALLTTGKFILCAWSSASFKGNNLTVSLRKYAFLHGVECTMHDL